MVEQVQQLKADELAAFQTAGEAEWQDRRYPFHYLPHLLGEASRSPSRGGSRRCCSCAAARTRPRCRSTRSSADQEIVVKTIGPQLARIAGITGATVLGTGEIVLILNPVHPRRARAGRRSDAAAPASRPRRRRPQRRSSRR